MKEQMESEERLKNSGLKTTKSRKAILDILIRSNQPMAAEQIFLVLKEEQITINLVCISCKKIITVQNCPLGSYEKTLENETHFNIIGHKLYLYGYCEACQIKKVVNKA